MRILATKKKERNSPIGKKIERLALIAAELRQGSNFPITRLTVLKNLCQDPEAAAHFAVHLTRLASKRMKKSSYKPLVVKAVRAMTADLKKLMPNNPDLYDLRNELFAVQNEQKPLKWGAARIIWSQETLLAENAANCLLRPEESAFWGYQIAAHYAQRYDSRYPESLIPASAPLIEDIAQFWRGWRRKTERGQTM